jgi:hypothetical protein
MITICWDPAASRLVFAESAARRQLRPARLVSMPHLSGHIYLVTSENGQYRLVILGRPTISGSLYGILTTLLVGHGSQLVPAPVRSPCSGSPGRRPGLRPDRPAHASHAAYRAELDAVMARDFARFPTGGRRPETGLAWSQSSRLETPTRCLKHEIAAPPSGEGEQRRHQGRKDEAGGHDGRRLVPATGSAG